ncbi:MAG: hypothetical protein ACOC56_04845, partial [Atribacterota bacterium]
DEAGNKKKKSGEVLVNPYFYVYFEDKNNTQINNFSVDGKNYENYMNETIYDYGLGNNTFEFSKQGYERNNFTLEFNRTSQINETFTIPAAEIFFEFINVDTGEYVENENTTEIEIIGDKYSKNIDTTNRNYTLQSLNIEPDEYQVIISNENYESVNTIFDYSNQEKLDVPVYMTPRDAEDVADVVVEVQDKFGNVQSGVSTQQYIWDSSRLESILINQKKTDYSGQTSFKIILDSRQYDFCAIYKGESYCIEDQIINVNTEKVIIPTDKTRQQDSQSSGIFDVDFPFSLTNTSQDNNISRITYQWDNNKQNVDEYILDIYETINGSKNKIHSDSSTSHNSMLKVDVNLSDGNKITAEAKISQDGEIRKIDSSTLNDEKELENILQKWGIHILGSILLISIGVGIGLTRRLHNVVFSHIGVSIAFLAIAIIFPSVLTIEYFFVVAFVNIIAILLITRKENLGGTPNNISKILNVLVAFIVMIFSLTFVLSSLEDDDNLDTYGEELLQYLTNENNAGSQEDLQEFVNSSQQSLDEQKNQTSPGGEDKIDNTLTIFIKNLAFVETFFSVGSKIFTIPETLYYILGVASEFLLIIVKVMNYALNLALIVIFFRNFRR